MGASVRVNESERATMRVSRFGRWAGGRSAVGRFAVALVALLAHAAALSPAALAADPPFPTLTCPNVTRNTDPNLATAQVTITPTASGGVAPYVIVSNPASGAFPIGATLVNVTVTDTCDNQATCSFTITVVDNQPPTITCPASVTVNAAADQCGAVVTFATPTVSDNAPGVGAPTSVPASGSTFAVGTTIVTSTVLDAAGNSASCTFSVTVRDVQAPTIACPANITVSNAAGQCGAVVTYATPTASDNCSGAGVVTLSPASGSFFSRGTTTVTASVTDAAGNAGSCTFTVTVNDTEAPTITCPANIAVSAAAGQCGAVVTYATPTASDNCAGVGVVTLSPASGSFFSRGTTTVTASVTDAAGNAASCQFTVTVSDTQAPTITCPANIAMSAAAGQCGAVVTFATPTATDNCPGVGAVTLSPASGAFFAVGTTTVTASVTDAAGNAASCQFTVTVSDTQAPAITCPANIAVSAAAGQCGAVVTFATPSATDNCPGVGAVTLSPASGSFFAVGTTTVTASVTDAAGNAASCQFTVTVSDTQAPTITCPANITQGNDANQCGATVTFATPSATDNCPGLGAVSVSPASGSLFAIGTTTVTAQVTDAAGNSTSCSFTVTVNDTQAPALTTTDRVVATDPNACGAAVTFTASVSDNCPGVSVAFTPASGSFFAVGASTVTAVATDLAGNATTSTFVVTVNDGQAPAFSCPPDVSVTSAPGQCGAVVTFAAPTVTDNCPSPSAVVFAPASGSFFPVGSTVVVARATDANGLTTTCQVLVTVTDDEPPQLALPSDITVTAASAGGVVVDFTLPTATDNCPGVGVPVCSPASGTLFAPGTTTVTCTVADAAGNVTTAEIFVNVGVAGGGEIGGSGRILGGCAYTGPETDPAQAAGRLAPILAALIALRARRRRAARA